MTLAEQASLMSDSAFRDRCKAAMLFYANYISTGGTNALAANNMRRQWARTAQTNPDVQVGLLQPNVVQDAKVQSDGANISDSDLQNSVNATVELLL